MNLLVLDIECSEHKLGKEFGVSKKDILWDIFFFIPKSSKLHLSLLGVRIIFMESIRAVVMKNY